MYSLMNAMAEHEFRRPKLIYLLWRSNVDILSILIEEIRVFLGVIVNRSVVANAAGSAATATAAAAASGGVVASDALVGSNHLAMLISNKYSLENNLHVRLQWLETILLKTDNANRKIFVLSNNHFDALWD